jgi:glycosyltransferase involved in cell wall biosynthesis
LELSIAVPLFNEEQNAPLLYRRIVEAIEPMGVEFEILFVDDGSTDRTFAIAAELAARDPRLRVVKFRRNYGQTPAMAAGIDNSRGRIIVTMDGDLQNDPLDIPGMVAMIDQGYDMVVGWRFARQDDLVSRKIPSRIANWLIGKVTGIPMKDSGCSLKAFRASVIRQIPLYAEMHRFIPAISSIAAPRIAEVKVRHHARQFGRSKYGLSRIYKVLLDLLAIKTVLAFASRPLVWFAMLALPFLFVSAAIVAAQAYSMLLGDGSLPLAAWGTAILFGSLAFFLAMGGMLGELVYKTGDTKVERFVALTSKVIEPRETNPNAGT